MKQMVVTLSSRVPFMRSAFTVVFVAGLLIRLVALGTLGPRVTNDSQIYLAAAGALRNGGLDSFLAFQLDGRLMYSLLLAAADALLGTNLVWGVGIVQAVLGSLTAVVIGKATLGATGSKAAGLLAASIVCVHITFVFWGVYILSDTLMLLLMSVSIDRLLALSSSDKSGRDGALAMVAALAAALSRQLVAPFVLVLPVLAAVGLRRDPRRRNRTLAVFALTVLVLAGVAVGIIGRQPRSQKVDLGERANYVIWQAVYISLEWNETSRGTYGSDIRLPEFDDIRPATDFYRTNALSWIESNPAYIFEQIGRKLRVFWSPILPEYSLTHKIISILYFSALYLTALIGFWKCSKMVAVVTTAASGILILTLSATLTLVDYDLRYRAPVELVMVPVSAMGALWLVGGCSNMLTTINLRRYRPRDCGRVSGKSMSSIG